MSSTISPNMGLIIPTVGSETGPNWALDINACLATIDQHDHSGGQGVPISPSGLNISSDLAFNGNNATLLRSTRFSAQSSALSGASDIGCLYVSGADLYYNDGTGNQVRITQGGSVTGSSGTITGLPSGTASASYASGTFTFQSATNTAANIDVGSVILRNNVASSKGLTLAPPSAMAADYALTLPSLPGTQQIMTLDASGNMAAPYSVDNSTIQVSSNLIGVKPLGIGTASLAAGAVTAAKLDTSAIAGTKFQQFVASGSFTAPTNVNWVYVDMWGGGGGGGGATGANLGGGGASGVRIQTMYAVTPGSTYSVVIGTPGGGGSGASPGSNGGNSSFDALAAAGGVGGGTGAGGGAAGVITLAGAPSAQGGQGSGSGSGTSTAGSNTYYAPGGTGGSGQGAGGGGGWLPSANGGNGGTFGGGNGSVANSGSAGAGGGQGAGGNTTGGGGQAGMVTVYWSGLP